MSDGQLDGVPGRPGLPPRLPRARVGHGAGRLVEPDEAGGGAEAEGPRDGGGAPADGSRPQPADPPSVNGLPVALSRLVSRCLEKSPDERFQSARDLAFALREVSTDSGSDSPQPRVDAPARVAIPCGACSR